MTGEARNREAPGRGFVVEGCRIEAPRIAAGLHVVATPIGNLGDVSLRSLATLAAADLVACEDTRVTGVLCARYGIARPLLAYHEHNAARQRPRLLAALSEGRSVALVSDAGTPLVSDPGYKLVVEAIAAGHAVLPLPGPSAALAALVAAGLPTDTFLFAGFLPPRAAARRDRIADLAATPATLIFYELPRRLAAALGDLADVLGGARPAAVARELTKVFEEVRRGSLATLAAEQAAAPPPKGEIVVVVGPPAAQAPPEAAELDEMLLGLLATRSVRDAALEVAARTGMPRRQAYERALALRSGRAGR